MTKPSEPTKFWLKIVLSFIGLIVMGSAAGSRISTRQDELCGRVSQCEVKIERSGDKLDQMADDISYMRGRFDMLMEQQAQRKRK